MTILAAAILALIAAWAFAHRAARRPGWGKVRLTDFDLALARFRHKLAVLDHELRTGLTPAIRRTTNSLRAWTDAYRGSGA